MYAEQDNAALDINGLQELADSFLSVGHYDKAQQYYEKAAALDPDNAAPYAGFAAVAMKRHLFDEAELAFRVARRLDPTCPKAYEGLGRIALQDENYERAFRMYLKCLELDPDNLTALLGLFQTSSQMGSFAKIIYYLEIYLDIHPDDSAVMFTLATLYMKENQYKKSKAILEKILAISANNKDAENLLEEVQQNVTHAAT